MTEGEKREGADDLFEDLDKFFAPIKDVDWPEPEEPDPASAEGGGQTVVVPPAGAAEEPPADTPPADPPAAGNDEIEPAATVWYDTESIETVAAAGEENEPSPVSDEPSEVPGQSDLFRGEDAPGAGASPTDRPSDEDVEAAAEHFAESIRSEAPDDTAPVPAGSESFPDDERGADELVEQRFGDEPRRPGEADLLSDLGAQEVEDDILSDLEESEAGPRTVRVGTEGLGGPSWQEPTSLEVGADLDRHGGRDVPAAFATGLVLAAAAFGGLLIGKAAFGIVAALIVLVAQGELFGVMHKHHKQPATAVGLVTGALILWAAYDKGEGAVLAMFALGTMATMLWFMAVPAIHRKETLVNVGMTAFNVAYIPVLGSFLLLTLSFGDDGRALVFSVIFLTFAFDTFAFVFGSIFGGSSIQRPLAPDTSPKKSWEGLIAAVLMTVILSAAVVGTFVAPFKDQKIQTVLLGLVISVAATFGDLAESLIKRDVGIKDMGSILPGHGGVLDRIDSLLFTAPAAYLLFQVLFS
jgi:phosphatidate cytidylyltransferase